MTARVTYIGDKLVATGFMLTGARVFTPVEQADEIWENFQKALKDADLILISQVLADLIEARLNTYKQTTPIPPVLILPSAGLQAESVRTTLKEAKNSLGLT